MNLKINFWLKLALSLIFIWVAMVGIFTYQSIKNVADGASQTVLTNCTNAQKMSPQKSKDCETESQAAKNAVMASLWNLFSLN